MKQAHVMCSRARADEHLARARAHDSTVLGQVCTGCVRKLEERCSTNSIRNVVASRRCRGLHEPAVDLFLLTGVTMFVTLLSLLSAEVRAAVAVGLVLCSLRHHNI